MSRQKQSKIKQVIIIVLSLSFALLITTKSHAAKTRTNTRSEVSFERYIYNSDDDPSTTDQSYSLRTLITMKVKKNKWRGQFQVLAVADQQEGDRSALFIQDLWAGYKASRWQVQVGYLMESWTDFEAFQPFEVLNARNYASNIVLPDTIGEPLAKAEFRWDTGSAAIYYGSSHELPKFPGPSSRLSLTSISISTPYWIDTDGSTRDSSDRGDQQAFRLRQNFGKVDLQFFYLNHQNRRFPLFTFGVGGIRPVYLPTTEVGFGYIRVVDAWLFKLEAVKRKFTNAPISLFTTNLRTTQPNNTELALGAERSYDHKSGATYTYYIELQKLNLEKSGEFSSLTSSEIREYAQQLTYFQHDLFLGVRWAANDHLGKEFRAVVIADLERGHEFNYSFSYAQMISNKWKGEAGLNIVDSPVNSSPILGLDSQHNDHRVHFKITRFF